MITSISDVANAEALVASYIELLTNEEVAADSLLPGWSCGHVLTHLSNNARGLCNLIEWALTGTKKDMYASTEQRGIEIEIGAKRDGSEIVADLLEQTKILANHFDHLMAGPLISQEVILGNGAHVHPHEIFTLRERELLVHLVDLGLGYSPNDWTSDFSTKTLTSVTAGKRKEAIKFRSLISGGRSWTGDQSATVDVFGDVQDLAAWLMGREPIGKLVTSDGSTLGKPPVWL